jgi:hypothetical protein
LYAIVVESEETEACTKQGQLGMHIFVSAKATS